MKQIWKQNINKSLDNNSKYIQNVLMNFEIDSSIFFLNSAFYRYSPSVYLYF